MLQVDPALRQFLEILARLSIPHAVGGSIASSIHGEPRSTHDSDVLVALRLDQVKDLAQALRPDFYVDDQDARSAVERQTSFNVIHRAAARKIDVFVAGTGLLDREQLARSIALEASPGGPALRITSAEVIVLRKLDWFRRGDETSQRQWRDILSVLRFQRGNLDEGFLDSAASELGLSELLQRARREAHRE